MKKVSYYPNNRHVTLARTTLNRIGRSSLLVCVALLTGAQAQIRLPRAPMPVPVNAPITPAPRKVDPALLTQDLRQTDWMSYTLPELRLEMDKAKIVLKSSSRSGGNATAKVADEIKNGDPLGSPESSKQNTPAGTQLICSTQRYNLKDAPAQKAMKTLDQNYMWVGSIVKQTNLIAGSIQPVNIPATRRQSFNITMAQPTNINTALIHPTQSDYNMVSAAIRKGLVGTNFSSTFRYTVDEQSSAQSSGLRAGLDVSAAAYSINAAGSYSASNKKNRVSAVFVQNSFTINADLQGQAPTDALLLNPTAADLTALASAAYVDSITYGRILFVEMSSSYSSKEMAAALTASYSGVSVNADVNTAAVLSNSNFNVYAAGGDETRILELIKNQRLGDYFTEAASATTLVPISYTARNFMTDQYAASEVSGEYAETVCNPNSIKVNYSAYFQLNNTDDTGGTDEVYGDVKIDGKPAWTTDRDHTENMNAGDIKSFEGQTEVTLNYGESRIIKIQGKAMDTDKPQRSDKDDTIGNWNLLFDLSTVAERFKQGETFVRMEFPWVGSDASSAIVIDFRRN